MLIRDKFKSLIARSIDAEQAFFAMRKLAINENRDPALAYVMVGLLKDKFTPKSVIGAVTDFLEFDKGEFNDLTDRRIHTAEKKFSSWLGRDQFDKSIRENNVAGFIDVDILYIIHPCVKPGNNRWQCTSFGKNIGPLGDTARKELGDLINDNCTSVIPVFAQFIPFAQLDSLLTNSFSEKNIHVNSLTEQQASNRL